MSTPNDCFINSSCLQCTFFFFHRSLVIMDHCSLSSNFIWELLSLIWVSYLITFQNVYTNIYLVLCQSKLTMWLWWNIFSSLQEQTNKRGPAFSIKKLIFLPRHRGTMQREGSFEWWCFGPQARILHFIESQSKCQSPDSYSDITQKPNTHMSFMLESYIFSIYLSEQ